MKIENDITFAVEHITPSIAERYLETNAGNRKCSRRMVTMLANTIRRGEWMLNGEAIKFDCTDKLLDGQHRLRAIIAANQGVDICVIRGLESDAFKTLDAGKGRTSGDYLYILNYKNPNALAAAGRMLFAYERGWEGKSRSFRTVSNFELLNVIARHPRFEVLAQEFMRKPLFTTLVPHSVGMFCFYVAASTNEIAARKFFLELATARFESAAPDYPVRVLEDALRTRQLEVIKPTSPTKMAWLVEAWNAYTAGKPLTRLSRLVETLPKFHKDPIFKSRK